LEYVARDAERAAPEQFPQPIERAALFDRLIEDRVILVVEILRWGVPKEDARHRTFFPATIEQRHRIEKKGPSDRRELRRGQSRSAFLERLQSLGLDPRLLREVFARPPGLVSGGQNHLANTLQHALIRNTADGVAQPCAHFFRVFAGYRLTRHQRVALRPNLAPSGVPPSQNWTSAIRGLIAQAWSALLTRTEWARNGHATAERASSLTPKKKTAQKQNGLTRHQAVSLCSGEDLNLQASYGASTSSWCVCQFHHRCVSSVVS
jgi:hypothetical protein